MTLYATIHKIMNANNFSGKWFILGNRMLAKLVFGETTFGQLAFGKK